MIVHASSLGLIAHDSWLQDISSWMVVLALLLESVLEIRSLCNGNGQKIISALSAGL